MHLACMNSENIVRSRAAKLGYEAKLAVTKWAVEIGCPKASRRKTTPPKWSSALRCDLKPSTLSIFSSGSSSPGETLFDAADQFDPKDFPFHNLFPCTKHEDVEGCIKIL